MILDRKYTFEYNERYKEKPSIINFCTVKDFDNEAFLEIRIEFKDFIKAPQKYLNMADAIIEFDEYVTRWNNVHLKPKCIKRMHRIGVVE